PPLRSGWSRRASSGAGSAVRPFIKDGARVGGRTNCGSGMLCFSTVLGSGYRAKTPPPNSCRAPCSYSSERNSSTGCRIGGRKEKPNGNGTSKKPPWDRRYCTAKRKQGQFYTNWQNAQILTFAVRQGTAST